MTQHGKGPVHFPQHQQPLPLHSPTRAPPPQASPHGGGGLLTQSRPPTRPQPRAKHHHGGRTGPSPSPSPPPAGVPLPKGGLEVNRAPGGGGIKRGRSGEGQAPVSSPASAPQPPPQRRDKRRMSTVQEMFDAGKAILKEIFAPQAAGPSSPSSRFSGAKAPAPPPSNVNEALKALEQKWNEIGQKEEKRGEIETDLKEIVEQQGVDFETVVEKAEALSDQRRIGEFKAAADKFCQLIKEDTKYKASADQKERATSQVQAEVDKVTAAFPAGGMDLLDRLKQVTRDVDKCLEEIFKSNKQTSKQIQSLWNLHMKSLTAEPGDASTRPAKQQKKASGDRSAASKSARTGGKARTLTGRVPEMHAQKREDLDRQRMNPIRQREEHRVFVSQKRGLEAIHILGLHGLEDERNAARAILTGPGAVPGLWPRRPDDSLLSAISPGALYKYMLTVSHPRMTSEKLFVPPPGDEAGEGEGPVEMETAAGGVTGPSSPLSPPASPRKRGTVGGEAQKNRKAWRRRQTDVPECLQHLDLEKLSIPAHPGEFKCVLRKEAATLLALAVEIRLRQFLDDLETFRVLSEIDWRRHGDEASAVEEKKQRVREEAEARERERRRRKEQSAKSTGGKIGGSGGARRDVHMHDSVEEEKERGGEIEAPDDGVKEKKKNPGLFTRPGRDLIRLEDIQHSFASPSSVFTCPPSISKLQHTRYQSALVFRAIAERKLGAKTPREKFAAAQWAEQERARVFSLIKQKKANPLLQPEIEPIDTAFEKIPEIQMDSDTQVSLDEESQEMKGSSESYEFFLSNAPKTRRRNPEMCHKEFQYSPPTPEPPPIPPPAPPRVEETIPRMLQQSRPPGGLSTIGVPHGTSQTERGFGSGGLPHAPPSAGVPMSATGYVATRLVPASTQAPVIHTVSAHWPQHYSFKSAPQTRAPQRHPSAPQFRAQAPRPNPGNPNNLFYPR
uniref:Uncharacterized protein n=1 Tax=Chromera velia CCMP2878 TaxID=1169474 RepID=A0A0G4GM94_9ALVE|eukprot:Cvel_22524.t1-p1 / transcript=Cvel_22524.t1 / gene=Cvel_22524 / organism=Chromera_velia_CCMP2878 / gene_product=hypothetical protein / transcript_product=hypothetical protein / location=Cvel_scaffold2222:5794-15951(-) / protein_length=954 / sequence_SO=supercontig / SO=protein_coding / is_pseudo=false